MSTKIICGDDDAGIKTLLRTADGAKNQRESLQELVRVVVQQLQ